MRAGAERQPGGAPSSPRREERTGERAGRAVELFADTALNAPAEAADRIIPAKFAGFLCENPHL